MDVRNGDGKMGDGPPEGGQAWLYWMLSEVHSGVQHLMDGHRRLETSHQRTHDRMAEGQSRMDWLASENKRRADETAALAARLTLHPLSPPTSKPGALTSMTDLIKATRDLAKAVASMKEWLTGASLVASSLYAIVNPDSIAAWWRAFTGGGP